MTPRKPITEETREKMRQAALRRSSEAEANRLAALRETASRAKMSAALKKRHAAGGREAEHFKKFQQKGHDASRKEVLTYSGIHAWVKRNWGKANRCELCGKENLSGRAVHWANKNHHYTRNREDWMMACRPCHANHDIAAGLSEFGSGFRGKPGPNKGRKFGPMSESRRAAQAKTYLLTAPTGETITVHNLTQYCQTKGLNASRLFQVAKGKERHYKGWKATPSDRGDGKG